MSNLRLRFCKNTSRLIREWLPSLPCCPRSRKSTVDSIGNRFLPARSDSLKNLAWKRLTRSIQTIPTFSVTAEANAEKLVALYERFRQSPTRDGVKLTITDLLLTIFADVLKRSPELCATWENNNEPRSHSSIDIGLAVATPNGVVAPVLRKVDALDLSHLAIKR